MVIIYGLVNPITKEIRYVGKTINSLKKRLSQHLCESNKSNPHKYNWIKKLKDSNLKPIIIELEKCNDSNWVEREKFWINELDNLTNLTQGGENGLFFTDEIRKKISDGVKLAWEDSKFRENMSKKMLEYWSDQSNRDRQSNIMLGNNFGDPEKSSLRLKELWVEDEYINKMSEQSKILWSNDEYKKKVLTYIQSDEHKSIVSARFKGKKLSEEHKLKMSNSSKNKKQVSINGVTYESITEASNLIPMNRDKIRTRLKSKNFNDYFFL